MSELIQNYLDSRHSMADVARPMEVESDKVSVSKGKFLVADEAYMLKQYVEELKNMKSCFEVENPVRMEEDLLFK